MTRVLIRGRKSEGEKKALPLPLRQRKESGNAGSL